MHAGPGKIVAGSILMGIGAGVALGGAFMVGSALVAAYQERVQQMEMPPSAMARHHWNRFKSAAAAGASEWNNGHQVETAPR